MKRLKVLIFLAELSLFYNTLILFLVSLNSQWVTTRAAGGQFETFPVVIRVLYLLMAFLMISLMLWLWKNRTGILTERNLRLCSFLKFSFAISTFMQLISRSADERLNAIPAAILTLTFWQLSKSKSQWRLGESNP